MQDAGVRGPHLGPRAKRQHRVRRLTISASDKYGLPTAIDDEVILGLVQVTKAAGFADRRVRFSRYQLIHLLGWRDEGRSYRRLEQSLKRWLGVTLYYENAWWDKAQKRWVDAHFHLLDELVLYRRPDVARRRFPPRRRRVLCRPSPGTKSVFRSFQAGFLKKLDLDVLPSAEAGRRETDVPVSGQEVSLLQAHCGSSFRCFACEHIGLSRRYDAAQLKRRLNPAIAELERVGFLTPLPASERYHRLRRGDWEVVFVQHPEVAEDSGGRSSACPTWRIG